MKQTKFSSECNAYGEEIDRLTIQHDYEGLMNYIIELNDYSTTHNSPEYTPLFYYLGTAYGTLANHFQNSNKTERDIFELRKQSLYYQRQALSLLKQVETDERLSPYIYTNYANDLCSCGRVIEAIKYFRKAISKNSSFGMAIGNYGRTLSYYANLVNDSGHHKELHCYAYQALKKALKISDPDMHEQAIELFKNMVSDYESSTANTLLSKPIIFPKYDLGKKAEQDYRKWCLDNHLFLNPLNDLIEKESAFAHDPLTITHYTEHVNQDEVSIRRNGEPPKCFAMLNQLKEEYIYSRFLCYEGTEKMRELHFADKNVKLSLSSFDYVNYSIRLEQIKSAFKNLFSIFDQVSFVINEFWKLGFSEREADAAHVFKSKKYPKDNIALTALYWSYCEFSEKFGEAECAYERDLKTLRNALEHKFVKIHETRDKSKLQIEDDSFYHISEDELLKHTLHLLSLVREWIMELVYAFGIEESKNNSKENAIQLDVLDFSDNWKI